MTDAMAEQCGPRIFLGRQPILGKDGQLHAYELLFRGSGAGTERAEVSNATQATATVIANAFSELSGSNALGPYRAFINVDHDFLFDDTLEILPKTSVVLEILEHVEPTSAVLARCQYLRDRGFSLAFDDLVELDPAYRPLLELADIIKVDTCHMDEATLSHLHAALRPLNKCLLAEKVETAEQFSRCKALGFDLFQGYFFARPSIIVGNRLTPSQLTLLRVLGLVLEDAETTQIEEAFKLEPGLTANLLRLTNSAASGLSTQITSIRHAITLLGRTPLQRWLQLLIYTNPDDQSETTSPLLQLAATRGRLMELLAGRMQARRDFTDPAFMVGIMSLMPALLGVDMTQLLEQLPALPRVRQALTERSGPYGPLLQIVEASEQAEPEPLIEALSQTPSIRAEHVEEALSSALGWAHQLAAA